MSNEDPTVADFIVGGFTNAVGIISHILGNTEDWEEISYLKHTLAAVRSMPPNFQDEIARPILDGVLDATGFDTRTDEGKWGIGELDHAIASCIRDAYSMAMSSLQAQEANRKKIMSGGLLR